MEVSLKKKKTVVAAVLLLAFASVAHATGRNEPFPQCNIEITAGRTQSPCSVSEFTRLWTAAKTAVPMQVIKFEDVTEDGYTYSATSLRVSAVETAIINKTGEEYGWQNYVNVDRILTVKIVSIDNPPRGEVVGGKIRFKILNESEGLDNFGQYWWNPFSGATHDSELYAKFLEMNSKFSRKLAMLDVRQLVPYVQYEVEIINPKPGYHYEPSTFIYRGVSSEIVPPIQRATFQKSWSHGVELNPETIKNEKAWMAEYSANALSYVHKVMKSNRPMSRELFKFVESSIYSVPQRRNYIPVETLVPEYLIRYYEHKSEEAARQGRELSLDDSMAQASAYEEYLKFYPIRMNAYEDRKGQIKGWIENDQDKRIVNLTKAKLKMVKLMIESQKNK